MVLAGFVSHRLIYGFWCGDNLFKAGSVCVCVTLISASHGSFMKLWGCTSCLLFINFLLLCFTRFY